MNRARVLHFSMMSATLFAYAAMGCGEFARLDLEKKPMNTLLESPAADAPLSEGGEILMQAHRAYRELRSYNGTIEISGAAHYPQNVFRTARKYAIHYETPDRLRLDGRDSNGDPQWIVAQGQLFQEDPDSARVGGVNTPREALLAHMGTSLQASVFLPAFLLGIDWTEQEIRFPAGGISLPNLAKNAQLKGTVTVDNHDCYEVECVYDLGTWVFAVDKESRLIRQVTNSESEDQMKVKRHRGGGGFSGKIQSSENVQTFHIDAINEPIDPTVFEID